MSSAAAACRAGVATLGCWKVWVGEAHVGAHVAGARQVWLVVKLQAGGAPHPLRALALSC